MSNNTSFPFESNSKNFVTGEIVTSQYGWRDNYVSNEKNLNKTYFKYGLL